MSTAAEAREARIDAWVEKQLARPEAQRPLTAEQNAVIASVLANQPEQRNTT